MRKFGNRPITIAAAVTLAATADLLAWRSHQPAAISLHWELDASAGLKFCTPPEGYPASSGVVIPLDQSMACTAFTQDSPEALPPHIRIAAAFDVMGEYDSVDSVANDERDCYFTSEPSLASHAMENQQCLKGLKS